MHPGHRTLAVLLLIGIIIGGTASGSIMHTAAPRSRASMTEKCGASGRPGWADGAFTGTIYQNDERAGTAAGFIRLGRNSQRGWFSGTWTLGATQGNMSGVFFGMLLLGCCTTSTGISMPLVGIMQSNTSWFSVRIISPPGQIHVSGARSASFLPAPDGPYDIGTTSVHLVDREREERFTEDPSDVREMMLQLWYPAAQAVGDRAAYMDAETFDWLKHEAPIPLFWIPDDAYTSVMPHAAGDAPPADGRFPVLLFSHGYDGVREIYTSLIETLVSHGYVVAAVQHPYVAGVTVFPDGRVIEHQPAPSDPEEADAYFRMAFDTVLDDIEYVLDVLPELDAPVRACLDLGRVGIYGHSFGGGASAATCNRDERVTAGAALDGFFHGGPAENGTARPFLSLLAEGHFQRDTTLRQMWNRTSDDIYMAEVAGAAHYSYTDVGLLLTHLAPLIPRPLVGFGSIEPKRLMAISNAYTLAFFDVYLKGQPLDTLLGLADRYPEVTFDYK